ncbi:MAG: transcription antitermination factor NusB [Coprobacter sp.]|nr:transcription antitermination factor NusB [Coprobacter sp.]
MINRILIRIKVVQILYSYFLKEDKDMNLTEKELFFSLDKTYELYHLLLLLMVQLTDAQRARIEMAKAKHLATLAEKNPNPKFIQNRFIAQLKANEDLAGYLNDHKISWVNEPDFIRSLLDKIVESDIYKEYMESADSTYEADRELWRRLFKSVIVESDDLGDVLESMSLYWNDDLQIISTFVLKSIKRFDESRSSRQPLLPMFKDDEDLEFARTLFRKSILNADKNKQLIDRHTQNWELDRVAFMDIVIMLVAVAELETFPAIPVRVTLNEYIEIAKSYSTIKSGHFINGVLDAIAEELKKEGVLTKE